MKPIALIYCDDCGQSVVLDENYMCIFKLGDTMTAVARCGYCGDVISEEISFSEASNMSHKGVTVFNWENGSKLQQFNFSE